MKEEQQVVVSYGLMEDIARVSENAGYSHALKSITDELSSMPVSRGAGNNSGFLFEGMDAANQTIAFKRLGTGEIAQLINDNGAADVNIVNSNGNVVVEQQMKLGYHGTSKYHIDWEKYKGMEIVVDKGNEELANAARQHGLKVRYSDVSQKSAQNLSKAMSAEGKVREKFGKTNNAPVATKLYGAAKQLEAAHESGRKAAKCGAAFTAGFSFGKNTYALIEGNMDLREALLDTGKNVVVAAGTSYAIGAVGSLISPVLVKVGLDSVLVTVGPIAAIMPTAAGPLFLMGMTIGTGYSICKSIVEKNARYRESIQSINNVLDQALSSMKQAYEDLDQTIKKTFARWDQHLDQGFKEMSIGIKRNDFERVARGLDTVMNVFDSHVMFKSVEEFDKFFYDDNAVLNL